MSQCNALLGTRTRTPRTSRWGLYLSTLAASMFFVLSAGAQTTYYSKPAATNFSDVASWGTNADGSGSSPASISSADDYVVANSSALSLNANASVRNLTINSGTLTVASNTLTVSAATGNASTMSVAGGTLMVSGGTIDVHGNVVVGSLATFNQSGGTIRVDGNSGTVGTSVAAGTAIFSLQTFVTYLTGGTILIVDPNINSTGNSFEYNNVNPFNPTQASTHVIQLGDGVSTDATANTSGFVINTFVGSSRFQIPNLTLDAGTTGNRASMVSTFSFGIARNLTITSGTFRPGVAMNVGGNITNNGTLQTTSAVNLALFNTGVTSASLIPQTISGTGTYRNATTNGSSTANFSTLLINNLSPSGVTFANANSLLSANGVTNTGTATTLSLSAGTINLGGGTFVLGTSTTTTGTLNFVSGGFAGGSMKRWMSTTTLPTTLSATVPVFPFVSSGNARHVFMSRSGAWTTAGSITATYNNAAGSNPVSVSDAGYTIERQSAASWNFAVGDGANLGATTLSLGLGGEGVFAMASNPGTAPRVMQLASVTGTHVAGSGSQSSPIANRSGLTSSTITAGALYIGIATADIGFYTIASGNWEDGSTWSTGSAPTINDIVTISDGHTVTINATPATAKSVLMNGASIINVNGSTLTVASPVTAGVVISTSLQSQVNINGGAVTVGNGVVRFAGFQNNGTLTISSGSLTVNGYLINASTSTFSQTGGAIVIDQNQAGSQTNSYIVGAGLQFATSNITLSGGTLTIVDPNPNTTTTATMTYTGPGLVYASTAHTLRIGDGVSTDAGLANVGFRLTTQGMVIGTLEINTLQTPATNTTAPGTRVVSVASAQTQLIVNGDVNILSGELWYAGTTNNFFFAKNITNNGALSVEGILRTAYTANAIITTTTDPQAIGGTGFFRNSTTARTADLFQLTINNGHPSGVTINVPLTLSSALVLINGTVNTTATNLLTLGTTTAGTLTINGAPTYATYVNGPFARMIPASQTGNTTYVFPVGKSAYKPYELVNPITTSGGAVKVVAEVFDGNAGGTPSSAFSALSTSRYWQVSIASGAANFTSSLMRLNDTRGSFNAVGGSATQTGTYSLVGGGQPTLATGSITTVTPATTSLAGFYLMATTAPPTISNLTITPGSGDRCSQSLTRSITADVTPAGAALTSVVISYSINGGTAQSVAMTNTSGNTWSGTIPAVTPSNATVTWSVVATDGNSLVTTLAGTSYQDNPLGSASVTLSANPTAICAGASTTLTATASNGGVSSASIGAGASTSSGLGITPYYHFYGGAKSQYIIKASELTAAGYVAGSFTSLAFEITSLGTTPLNSFSISMGHTSSSAMVANAPITTGLSTVYSNAAQVLTLGVNTYTFTTPFVWNGTSNIVISVVYSNVNAGNTSSTVKSDVTAFTASGAIAADNATAANILTAANAAATGGSATTSGTSTSRPRMTLAMAPPVLGSYAFAGTGYFDNSNTNSITITPASTNTYVVQGYELADMAGCSTAASAGVTVTVNPLPTAPSATNSSHCGTAVPTASVASTSGMPTPTFKWYSAPTGGTLLQSSTSTTYTTAISSTTTFYVSELNTTTGCEGARTAVTVTVVSPDAVAASADLNNVCPGTTITLSAAQTGSTNTYTYTWTASPVSGSGIPTSMTGASVQVVPTAGGTYTYTVTAVDGSCTTTSTVNVTISAPPTITTATGPASVCPSSPVALAATSQSIGSGTATLGNGTTAVGSTNTAAGSGLSPFAQYYESTHTQYLLRAADLTATGLRAGNITSVSFTVTTADAAMLNFTNYTMKMGHTNTATLTAMLTPTFTTVYGPSSLSGATTTGTKTITFTTPFNWNGTSNIVVDICFANDPGGAGTFYTTNALVNGTTVPYTAVYGLYQDNANLCGAATGTNAANTSSLLPNMTFAGQVVTDITASANFSWTWNPGGLTGASVTATSPANNTAAPVNQVYTVTLLDNNTSCSSTAQVTVSVNPTPSAPTATNSSQCGTAVPTASVASTTGAGTPSFKWYDAASGGNMVQSSTSTTYTSAISSTTTFYVSEVSAAGCESARTAVTVTVTSPDAVSASANSPVCAGTAVNLLATQTGSTNNYTYTWTATPSAGSGIGAGGVTGASTSVTPTVAGTYAYLVTAVDGTCTTTSTVNVTVNGNPSITTATGPSTVCSNAPVALTATIVGVASGTASIGTASTTAGGTGVSPFSQLYESAHTQYLIRASDLTAAGISAGNITSVTFNVTTASSTLPFTNYTMKMANTAATALTGLLTPTFTTVYNPQGYPAVSTTGAKTIAFNTPFNWDGTSNVVMDICFFQAPGQWTGSSTVTATTKGYTAVWGYYMDGSNTCGTTGTNNTSGTALPDMTFAAQVATNVASSYNLVWNPGGLTGASVTATSPANNTASNVNQVYTVTATDPATGCFSTAQVTVAVKPVVAAPIASNSTQCGTGVPTASVASSTGLPTPTFKWYDAASGGNMLQSSTSTTYTTAINATTTFYVSEYDAAAGCESGRTAVTVTVNQPDAVTASANGPVCLGSSVNLSVAQTGSTNTYTYTWTASPATGSGISGAGAVTGSAATVTPTAAGTYVYTVTAVDGPCTTTSTVNVVVNANPSIATTTATPSSVCSGGSVLLAATATSIQAGTATIGTDNAPTKITTNGVPYRTGSSGFVRNQYLITAAELTAKGLQPGDITSMGFVVTTAGPTGTMSNLTFKMAQVNNTALTTTFLTTPLTTVLTLASYAPVTGDNVHTLTTPFTWNGTSNILIDICGQVGTGGSGCTMATTTTSVITTVAYGAGTDCTTATGTTISNARPVILLGGTVAADVTANYGWVWNPGNLSGATVNATTPNTSGVVTYTVKATDLPTGCFSTATVNVTVGAALVPNGSASPATICVGASSTLTAAPTGGGAPFTYTWKDGSNTTISTSASVSVSPTSTTTYTLAVTDACGVTQTQPVTVTVTQPPTAVINETSPVAVCATSANLTSSTNAATPSYVWNFNGSPAGVTTANYTVNASGSYTVKVTDGATGCFSTSAPVTVNLQTYPASVAVTPLSAATICLGQSQTITASATFANGPVTIMTEDFNGATPTNFTISNGAGATNTVGAWTMRTSPYTYTTILTNVTIDGSKFILANSDEAGSGSTTEARLTSAAFSTVGYTAVSVNFKHFYRSVGSVTFAGVEYSTNGTTWTTVPSGAFNATSSTGGANNPPTITSVSLNLPAGALNQANVQIRFRYDAGWDYYWGIDDVRIQGNTTGNFAWASTTGAGIPVAGQSANTANNSIAVTPTAAGTYVYTVTASVPGNSCTNTATVTVNVLTPSVAPTMLNSSATGSTCAGSNVILTQTGGSLGDGAHWQWYRDAAFTQAVGGQLTSGNAQITVAPTATTTYYLRAEGGTAPCASNISGAATVTVTVATPLSASIAAAQPVLCETGSVATLNITNGPANGSVTVTTNGANQQTFTLDGSGNATFNSDPLNANATFTITSVSDGTCTTPTNTSAIVYVGVLIANPINNHSECNGTAVAAIPFAGNFPAGTQYNWTSTNPAVGLAQTSGTGTQLPAFTATNSGTTDIYTDISVTPILPGSDCKIRAMVFRITVRPTPTINGVGNQTVCAGTMTSAVTFSSPTPGTGYTWTNSNPAIGIAASGGGNLPAFVAQNSTGNPTIVGTFTVTPHAVGCAGPSTSFTITVNRSVAAISYSGSPYCQGGTVNPVVTGTRGGTFSSTAGLTISATTGQINLGQSQPGTYTITYTAPASGGACGGAVTTQITIKPQATVNTIGNQEYCQGMVTAPIAFTGTATSYAWSNDNTSIGLAASGTGTQLPSFNTMNGGPLANDAYIAVMPLGNGTSTCNGRAIKFRFRVKFCPPVTQAGGTDGGSATARMASQVVVGPNPTTNRVTINYTGTEAGPFTVQLLSQFGQVMSTPVSFTGNTFTLDLTGRTPGVYMIRMINTRTNTMIQKQIVKL